MEYLRLKLFWDAVKNIKLSQWFFILIAISIIFLITRSGSGGYDSSAERPSYFDKTINKYK